MLRTFRDALRDHGYVEGQNLSIAFIGRKDRPSRFPTSLPSSFAAMSTSSLLGPHLPHLPPKRRPPLFRSSWWESETRWARASSAVWRGQAGISQAL
jgi:hypothetical protein